MPLLTGVGVGIGGCSGVGRIGVSKMLKLYIKVFYVMGKVLSGKLFCTGTDFVDDNSVISEQWEDANES